MVKLFSHTDLDGIGYGILAKLVFENDVDISYCDYENIDSSVRELSKSELMECCIAINKLYIAACQRIQILENQLDKKISEKYQTNRE